MHVFVALGHDIIRVEMQCTSAHQVTQLMMIGVYPIIRITTYAQPSPYAELLTTSSTGADMGTTAPCRTGLASTGVLRLGNRCGRREWSAVPTVCSCVVVEPLPLLLLALLDVGREGGSGD